MSAIAGMCVSDGKQVNCRDLSKMLATMRHRGPDNASIWPAGSAGLGHCLLRTTPESRYESLAAGSLSDDFAIAADTLSAPQSVR